MDIQPTSQQPISDDQELAKVLAGVNQQAEEAAAAPVASDTPTEPVAPLPDPMSVPPAPVEEPEPVSAMPTPMPAPAPVAMPSMPAASGDLETIKQDALSELRPLVDKLNVSPEEKFDTYLLLLRSTDDQALIAPAHEAARNIADEARRAQALLDVIKEIDYLSNPPQPGM
jgi:hypothetical protein